MTGLRSSPYVEDQAVLIAGDLTRVSHVELDAVVPRRDGVAHAFPRFRRKRRAPAELSDRRLRERDALPDVGFAVGMQIPDDVPRDERALRAGVRHRRRHIAPAADAERGDQDQYKM